MGKMLLLLAALLTGIGLLIMFSGVFDMFEDIHDNFILPLTENTTAYTSSEGDVPNYNSFDHIIMHNLPYLCYGGAMLCIIIGLGQMKSGE